MKYQTIDGLTTSYITKLSARIQDKVEFDTKTNCRVWAGCKDRDGYGRISVSGQTHFAHRVAYELANGPIPADMFVCHQCDNNSCVNPTHLFIGTHKDSTQKIVEWAKEREQSGVHNVRAILTPENVKTIRQQYANKEHTLKQLGEMYGVHLDTIHKVVNRITWQDV